MYRALSGDRFLYVHSYTRHQDRGLYTQSFTVSYCSGSCNDVKHENFSGMITAYVCDPKRSIETWNHYGYCFTLSVLNDVCDVCCRC